jgi:uncharacterized protein YlxP (DUF503 family)
MHVCALEVELRVTSSTSLKDKRSVVRHVLDTTRRRFSVATAEVDHQDRRQLALLGFAAVSESAGHVEEILDRVERFVWSHPEIEVLSTRRRWLDDD